MNIDIILRPGSTMAKVSLTPGEHLTAEGGSMVAMSPGVNVTTTTYKRDQGNIFGAIKRVFSGESFFMNHYTAPSQGGEVWVAPTLMGDMFVQELQGQKLIVQSGSYVASSEGVNVDFNWQGFKSLLSGESMFWLSVSGQGKVLINSYGVIYPVKVDGEYIVDTGHIVAFDETLNFSITKAGKSWMSSFLGGEGLVCKFKGKGTVWCQSHNPKSFGYSIGPKLKPRK
ncbi:MAG: TIGR00266 family protein [Marinilabiliaceae bacterium]|nr:TIGR00266 family protein [Marinilabiliaceae bacterium]